LLSAKVKKYVVFSTRNVISFVAGGNICQDCKSEYQERLIPGLTSLSQLDNPQSQADILHSIPGGCIFDFIIEVVP
jgi:hypothetical protein